MTSEDAFRISRIKGNASDNVKRALANPAVYLHAYQPSFGAAITDRLICTEISLDKKLEEPAKLEAKVVVELEVKEDMLNGAAIVHGGCSAFLIDICSSLSLAALNMTITGVDALCVSSTMNILFHSPAGLGDQLRIVSTTLTLGARIISARTEIWSLVHHRLVASGTHMKMQPSLPKHSL
ncbi:hypothetical protein Ac2012v2_004412 [Leucoagaricus gongylophorus]